MDNGAYQLDGIVFTYNQLSLHDELGETAHHQGIRLHLSFKENLKKLKLKKFSGIYQEMEFLLPLQ